MNEKPRYKQKLKTVSLTVNERELKELLAVKKELRKPSISDTIRFVITESYKTFFASK